MLAMGLKGDFEPVTRKVHERECFYHLLLLDKYQP